MARSILRHLVRVPIALVVVLLSASVAAAVGGGTREQAERASSVQGDIVPFGIAPTEVARACVAGVPAVRGTDALSWQVRFITAEGDIVSTDQLRVPRRGFRCADLSYEEAVTRVHTSAAPEPTGRIQLAVQLVPLFAGRELAPFARGSGESTNIGTLEIVEASGQTRVTGRFGIKTYDVSSRPGS
jgi:hypothetical protein